MSRVKISVTQDDIDHGIGSNCVECPIARALKRHDIKALVAGGFISLLPEYPVRPYVNLPRSANRFIRRFDNGKPVEPFKFFLNVPEDVSV